MESHVPSRPPRMPESLVTRFAAHARRQPAAAAVVTKRGNVTYAELSSCSNRVAERLGKEGVRAGDIVVVMHERTEHLLAVLLGILKARCAYCPVDPAYPDTRIRQALDQLGARVAVSSRSAMSRLLSVRADIPTFCVDDLVQEAPTTATPDLEDGPEPGDAAYVLFTSGSTGTPKGVVIEHHSLWNFLQWAESYFGTERLQSVLATSALSFDSSVFELFAPLYTGGTVVLLESAMLVPGFHPERDSLLSGPPSVLSVLLRHRLSQAIKTVVLAGEPVRQSLVAELRARLSDATLYNCYGLTEATIYSTAARLEGEISGCAPIGRPIASTEVYLLDSSGQAVQMGCEGEMFIGGEGVGRGYIGRPALTSERFVQNPFGPGRLYRTGDVARWQDDGTLLFVGRLDDQVKVRGFRIELGDVEAHMQSFPGVSQCAATVDRTLNVPMLIAYYSAVTESATEESIRLHLRERLPPYMLPQRIVRLESLPLNESGKIARQLLGIGSPQP